MHAIKADYAVHGLTYKNTTFKDNEFIDIEVVDDNVESAKAKIVERITKDFGSYDESRLNIYEQCNLVKFISVSYNDLIQ